MSRVEWPPVALALAAAALFVSAYLAITTAVHVALVSLAAVTLFMACIKAEYRAAMAARASVIVIGLPLIAWGNSHIWLLYGVMAACVPFMARDRALAVPVYVFALLLLPALEMGITVGSLKLFDFGAHDALAVGAAFAVRGGRVPAGRRGFDLVVGATILLIGAALSRETSVSHLLRQSLNVLIDLGLPYYVVSRGLRSSQDVRMTLLWLGCGGVTLAAILGYESVRGWPMYNELYPHYGVPMQLLVKARAGYLRAGGPFNEPTSIAMVQSMCILAIAVCGTCFRSRRHHLVVFAAALLGLLAPQSRGAWIGLFLALLVADGFRGRYSVMLVKAGVVGVLGGCLYLGASVSPHLAQSIGLSGDSSDTADYRRMLLDRGMAEFWRSPVIGYSMPALNIRLADMRQGEGIIDFVNAYVWIALISGTLGMIIFFGAFLYCMRLVWRHGRRADGAAADGATYVFACLFMCLEMLFFTSFGTRPAIYIYVIFAMAAVLVTTRERRQQTPPVPAPPIAPPPVAMAT